MIKYIVRDFFGAFRISSLKQNKASYQCIFISVYFICITVTCAWGSKFMWRDVLIRLSVLLPMIFSYGSACMHSVQLTKIIYLCPMNPEERRSYIYGSYYFRIGIHMLIVILGLCIVVSNTRCDLLCIIQLLLNHMVIAALVDIDQRTGKIIFAIVFGATIMLLGIFVDFAGIEPEWLKWIAFSVYAVIQLPLGIWYVRYIRKTLHTAVFFETISV